LSEVEQYWKAVSEKFGLNIDWNSLHPQEQHQVIMSINLLLQILDNHR
jgi:hypothetical protein